MSIFRNAFERVLGLRVWALVTGLLVLGGVTAVVAQTNPGSSGSGAVSTLAGSGVSGFADGPAATAKFYVPRGVAVDGSGSVYVADTLNHRIRKIDSLGVVSTLAGSGVSGFADGPAATAQFNEPFAVEVDRSGNVFVADRLNHRIRRIDSLGVVSTLAGPSGFADGPAGTAQYSGPHGVAVDGLGNVYVADRVNHRIQKIDSLGVVSTLAGSGVSGFADGPAATAQFNYPIGVAADGSGNVYVAESSGHRIRKIDSLGVVSTLAGSGVSGFADGPAPTAQFSYPYGVAVDGSGNVYVGDMVNFRIRKIANTTAQSTTTTTTVPAAAGTLTAKIIRLANSPAGDSVYEVTLKVSGVTTGSDYEFVVPSGHVPPDPPNDPQTQRHVERAVSGVVQWQYNVTNPRGIFTARVYVLGANSPLSSVEVK